MQLAKHFIIPGVIKYEYHFVYVLQLVIRRLLPALLKASLKIDTVITLVLLQIHKAVLIVQ